MDGKTYSLKPYRKWLITNRESLCDGHFIRTIIHKGKFKHTYDWQSIYHRSEVYLFLWDYIKYYEGNTATTGSTDSIPVEGSEQD